MAQAVAAASAEAKRTAAVGEERKVEFSSGPLSVLLKAAKSGEKVLVSLRNNHKLMASVKAFDRHCNMVLEDVREMWTEPARTAGGKPTAQSRVVNKMFLRGDSVIIVVRNSS